MGNPGSAAIPPSLEASKRGNPEWFLAAGVTALALAIRFVVLAQTRDLPFFTAPLGDPQAYVAWAARILAGDLLGRGEGVFYQAPLYPYLLAAAMGVAGVDGFLLLIRGVQISLAAGACGLLVLIGAKASGRIGGVAAGLLLACYAPSIAWDVQIGKESFALSLGVLLLALLLAADRKPKAWLLVAAGASIGALALLRETALALGVVAALWIGFGFPAVRGATRGRWLVAWVLGLLGVLAPVALHNLAAGGGLAITTAQAGPNFYIGNHAGATGSYVPLLAERGDPQFERRDAVAIAEQAVGHPMSPGAVSRYWFARGLEFWGQQPMQACTLLLRKLRLALQAEEIADTEADWIYRRVSPLLAKIALVGHFGVIGPLAAVGVVLGGWSRRTRALLLGWLLAGFAGLVVFYVLGRYRVLLLPPVVLLAGAGVTGVAREIRNGFRPRLAAALALGVGLAILANGCWREVAPVAPAEANLAVAYARTGRFAEAEMAYRRALAAEPGAFVARLGLGNLLRVLGRPKEAVPHLEQAVRLAPGDADARAELALARAAAGSGPQ